MKYKIGDKVKIRKDLKGGCYYNGLYFADEMEIYKGKIATITEIENDKAYRIDFNKEERYRIGLDEGVWCWSDDMFENNVPTEKQSNDMKKLEDIVLKKGDFVELDDGFLMMVSFDYSSSVKDSFGNDCNKITKIKRPTQYETIYEALPETLDKVEKKYLKKVLRPFKDSILYIAKFKHSSKTLEWIYVKLALNEISFPYFEVNTMYKGMEVGKRYTLEELGLFK